MNPLGLSYIDDPSEYVEEIQSNQNLIPKEEPVPNMEMIDPVSAADDLVVGTALDRKPSSIHTKVAKEVTEKKKKEDNWRSLKASYRSAEYSWEINLLAADILNGDGDPKVIIPQIRKLEAKMRQEQSYIQNDGLFKHAINSAAGIIPPVMDIAAGSTKVGGYAALGAGATAAALTLPTPGPVDEAIGIPTAMTLAFGVGTQAQAARMTARAESGAIYWELINMKDDNGNHIDPELIEGISQGVGAVNGLAEVFGIRILMRFLPGTRRLLGEVIQNSSDKVVKSGLMQNLVKQYIKKYPQFVGKESGIELGQAIVTTAGEEMTKHISNELDKTTMTLKSKEQILSELGEELRSAAEGIALTGLPFPAISAAVDSKSTVQQNNPEGAEVLPPNKKIDPGEDLWTIYNNLREKYISNTDEQSVKNRAQNLELVKDLESIVGQIEKTFPDVVKSPEQALALNEDFSVTELNTIMEEAGLKSAKLKDEAVAVATPVEKFTVASRLASGEVISGNLGGTHPDLYKSNQAKYEAEYAKGNIIEDGFINLRGDNKFLTRAEALERVRAQSSFETEEKGAAELEGAEYREYIFSDKASKTTMDMVKLNKSMEVAMKHQGARESLEELYKKETGATGVDQKIFQPWLKNKLDTAKPEKVKKPKRSQVQLINSAIQLYIDSKRSPEYVEAIYKKSKEFYENEENIEGSAPSRQEGILTQEQLAIVEASKNLTKDQIKFADKISEIYEKIGQLNLEEGVLRNLEDNYAARMWDLSLPDAQRVYSTFYKETKHAKERMWNTIVEGWVNGAELLANGATQNLATYKDTLIRTLMQRRLFNALKEAVGEVDSIKRPGKKMRQKLFLPYQVKGYRKIDLSNFKIYSPLEIGEPGGTLLETEDGTILRETAIYAPEKIAEDIENLFGVSWLKKSSVAEWVSKYNALVKIITLALSGFHALAFVSSYYLGASTGFTGLNIYKSFKDGNRMAENLEPIFMQGVRNGLTVDLQQDWQRNYLKIDNIFNTLMEKTKVTGWIKNEMIALNDRWLNWVFSSFGAGLKVKTFTLEYQKELARFPDIDPDIIAKNVAELVNEDFGGLHLKRMHRSPTRQHLLQLGLLAPDWSESNLRTVTGMFRRTGQNPAHIRQLHRHFWARIVMKGLITTAFLNLSIALLTGTGNDRWEDIEDFFTKTMRSWKRMIKELGRGNYKRGYKYYSEGTDTAIELVREATSVNITPIFAYFGGDPDARKYFSIFRHFADPVKFMLQPAKVLKHKLSMAGHVGMDFINQEDWKGRRYTTFPELMGGEGLVTYKSRYAEGTPFFDSWYLSYALSQVIGHTPIGMNNLISSISGETEYADSMLNTLGVHVATKRRR